MLYGQDLASIHDARFGEIARSAAPFLLRALKRAGFEEGTVIDLGCGSGISTGLIAAAGYDVLGVDASPAMLSLARRRVRGARFRKGSLFDVELPPAVAVAGIGESFNYFTGRPISDGDLAGLFRKIHRALLPGGLLLFDMAAPGRVRAKGPARSHLEAPDWAILVTVTENRRRRVLTRRITAFRKTGSSYRRSEETHFQRLFAKGVVLRLLRQAGFRALRLRGYDTLRFPPGLVGYLASKATSGR